MTMRLSRILPELPRIGQPEQTFVCTMQTERYDQMSETSASLSAILALAARIERDPRFVVRDIYAHTLRPFVEVKDTIHGVIVGFSSEDDYVMYLQIVHTQRGGRHHA
jgi:hypothetical protein